MKIKIVFLIIIIISFFSFSIDYKKSKIIFKKSIIESHKLNLSYYTGGYLLNNGPLFINTNEIVFYQFSNDLLQNIFIININNNNKINLVVESDRNKDELNFIIEKIGTSIYIDNFKDIFILENSKIINYKLEDFNLIDDYYYAFQKGIFKKSNDEVVVYTSHDDFIEMFVTSPIISKNDKNNIYWLSERSKSSVDNVNEGQLEESFTLYKYNIKDKKAVMIYDGVACFSIVPNDPNYLLIFARGSKYNITNGYYPGDFIIIKNNGEVVKNFDKEHYDLKEEFFIQSFDINENNEISAIGFYFDYSKDLYKPKMQRGLLLLELKTDGKESTKSSDKKTYYTPNVDNLRFRASPDLQGKFIRSLIKGEKLELIEKGKADTVNGVKGTWVKVKTEKGEVGWCFDVYLKEL